MADKAPAATKSTKNTGMAALAYVLFFIPLLTDAKNDPFVKFHVKQSLVLLIVAIGWNILERIFWYIPMLGWIAGGLIGFIVSIAILVLWIKGLLNALNGKEEELPLIGQYASQFKF